jgi:hypothetical protein
MDAVTEDLLTPVVLSNEALAWAIKTHTGAIVEKEEVPAFFEEIGADLKLQGEIRYLALTYSGKRVDDWKTAIDWQAMEVSQAGVWGYAGAHDVMEFLKQALDGSSEGTGAYYRLKALIETVIPYCTQNQIPLPDVVLAKENKSKLAQVGERAPALIEAQRLGQITAEDAQEKIKSMVADAIDPDVTVESWKDKHPAVHHRDRIPSPAWIFMEPNDKSYLVIRFETQKELDAATRLLDGRIATNLGQGSETFLNQLYAFIGRLISRQA